MDVTINGNCIYITSSHIMIISISSHVYDMRHPIIAYTHFHYPADLNTHNMFVYDDRNWVPNVNYKIQIYIGIGLKIPMQWYGLNFNQSGNEN